MPSQASDLGNTAGRPRRHRAPMHTARYPHTPRHPFPVPFPIPRRGLRPLHDAMPARRMGRIRVPAIRTSIVRTSMNAVRVRAPRAVPVLLISVRTRVGRLRPPVSLVPEPPRAPRERRHGLIRHLDRVQGTIPSAASRACMCPRRATSPGRIPWHGPRSNAVAGVQDRVDGEDSVRARVRPRRVARGSGDSIAVHRVPAPAPAPDVREADASEVASRPGRRPRTVLPAVAAAERQGPSDGRAAGPRVPGRTGSRRGATSRRSRLPSSEG